MGALCIALRQQPLQPEILLPSLFTLAMMGAGGRGMESRVGTNNSLAGRRLSSEELNMPFFREIVQQPERNWMKPLCLLHIQDSKYYLRKH